jgi:hypothetical protein
VRLVEVIGEAASKVAVEFRKRHPEEAFKAIGATRRREGFGRGGTWYWSVSGPMSGPQLLA